MSDRELIGGKYYLIDEEKCLYKKVGDNGIIYREKGGLVYIFARRTALFNIDLRFATSLFTVDGIKADLLRTGTYVIRIYVKQKLSIVFITSRIIFFYINTALEYFTFNNYYVIKKYSFFIPTF